MNKITQPVHVLPVQILNPLAKTASKESIKVGCGNQEISQDSEKKIHKQPYYTYDILYFIL